MTSVSRERGRDRILSPVSRGEYRYERKDRSHRGDADALIWLRFAVSTFYYATFRSLPRFFNSIVLFHVDGLTC